MNDIAKFHHYVPVCYLKHFTPEFNRNGSLMVTHVDDGKQRPSTPAREGAENDFYTVEGACRSDHFESLLAEYESTLAPIWNECVKKQALPLDFETRVLLIEFVASFRVRNLSQRQAFEKRFTESMNAHLGAYYTSPEAFSEMLSKIDVSDAEVDMANPEVREEIRKRLLENSPTQKWEFHNNTHMSNFVKQMETISHQLLEFHWQIFSTEGPAKFVTSDNPLVAMKLGFLGEAPKSLIVSPPTAVVLPMNPTTAIVGVEIWDKRMSIPAGDDFVRQINSLSLRFAHRHTYGMTNEVSWSAVDGKSLEAHDLKTPRNIIALRNS